MANIAQESCREITLECYISHHNTSIGNTLPVIKNLPRLRDLTKTLQPSLRNIH